MSYNQPKLSGHACWNGAAITVVNSSQMAYHPLTIFVNTNNTLYIARDAYGPVLARSEGGVYSGRIIQGGYGLFVTDKEDVYSFNQAAKQVDRWSINATSSQATMFSSAYCGGLFVDMNNTLYCSAPNMNQVVTKSLHDTTNTLIVVAGTGCGGSTSNSLSSPIGIFVDLNFTLYVADSANHRIQRFDVGQKNGTTMAGNGAANTINLLSPRGVVLDGDGYLFIADTSNHRIVGSGPDGFRCVAACSGGQGTAANQLSSPQSISFDSYGNIWVGDFDNNRVQKFVLHNDSCGK